MSYPEKLAAEAKRLWADVLTRWRAIAPPWRRWVVAVFAAVLLFWLIVELLPIVILLVIAAIAVVAIVAIGDRE